MSDNKRKPLLVYDGDCDICCYWVNYWQKLTGTDVEYQPYQKVASDYPAIQKEDFKRSIQLIVAEDTVYSGARAVYFLLRNHFPYNVLSWLYQYLPGFHIVAESTYIFFARHRGMLRWVSRILWGKQPEPAQYHLVSWLFLRLLGLIYLSAFISFGVQITGLIGEEGILPVGIYLEGAREFIGWSAYWKIPTIFWLATNDYFLVFICFTGACSSMMLTFNVLTRVSLVLNFVIYLSLVYAGQTFMQFQWDLLLLECGFLAIFLPGKSRIIIGLYRWLVFRFMFLSGVVKLISHDPSWDNLTALRYHFETQPLPTPLAWYAHNFPDQILITMTASTLFIELILPFFIFSPRNIRFVTGHCFLLLQVTILLTGNYNFFNFLTIAILLFMFDDAAIKKLVLAVIRNRITPGLPSRSNSVIAVIIAAVIIPISTTQIWRIYSKHEIPGISRIARVIAPLRIVNTYGPFAVMTKTRHEIIIEGSDDRINWQTYGFRYKPDDINKPLKWIIPHQPRLDWQMWFAALATPEQQPWFRQLLVRLLQGRKPVTQLFMHNPFPDQPPKYIRALFYEYQFTDPERHKQAQWWYRKPVGIYYPIVQFKEE